MQINFIQSIYNLKRVDDIPFKSIWKISLIGFPLLLGIGIFNLIFERTVISYIGIIPITLGMISFASLI